jgi:hypothetical protein
MNHPRLRTTVSLSTISGFLIVVAAIWQVWMAPRWNDRLSDRWNWRTQFVGVMTWADPATGTFPTRDTLAYFARDVRVASQGTHDGTLSMVDTNTTYDTQGRKAIWQYTYRALVDAHSGAYVDPVHRNEYYVFPRHVEKGTYKFRQSYVQGVPLTFQREEYLDDVLTYLFAYRGRGEYTTSYTAGTPEFPPLTVPAGHTVRCADDQFVFRAWVEPVTGEIVKLQESCRSGDYIYDRTEHPIRPVARWAGESSGDDVRFRLEHVRTERLKVLALGRYAAPALAVTGLLGLCVGLARGRRS